MRGVGVKVCEDVRKEAEVGEVEEVSFSQTGAENMHCI